MIVFIVTITFYSKFLEAVIIMDMVVINSWPRNRNTTVHIRVAWMWLFETGDGNNLKITFK